jgi:hypothetical protein
MDNIDMLFAGMAAVCIIVGGVAVWGIGDVVQHEKDYGLGSAVTTTAEYEILTNDSFTGVVVRGEGWRDPALTVRNRDDEERRIATKWLTPV